MNKNIIFEKYKELCELKGITFSPILCLRDDAINHLMTSTYSIVVFSSSN